MSSIKYIISKLFHAPRKLRRLFLSYYNRFLFWLNDVEFGKNMQVMSRVYLTKRRGSSIISVITFFVLVTNVLIFYRKIDKLL